MVQGLERDCSMLGDSEASGSSVVAAHIADTLVRAGWRNDAVPPCMALSIRKAY